MNYLKIKPTFIQLISGALILGIGFIALSAFSWAWWSLFITGMLAWFITFQKEGWQGFKLSKKVWISLLAVFITFCVSMITALISKSLGFNWAANPFHGTIFALAFKVPLMLMGEELLSIWILESAQSKGLSFIKSTLLSSAIFGLLHIFVYWDGGFVSSLIHVLLLQSVARLIFNYVYIKTGRSLWGSWLTHYLFDTIGFLIVGAVK